MDVWMNWETARDTLVEIFYEQQNLSKQKAKSLISQLFPLIVHSDIVQHAQENPSHCKDFTLHLSMQQVLDLETCIYACGPAVFPSIYQFNSTPHHSNLIIQFIHHRNHVLLSRLGT